MDIAERINGHIRALARLLTERGETVTAAESLTAGMISASFADVPGCSDWFSHGFVTYSDRAKAELLGIDPELIARETAVSADVGIRMAEGALKRSGADYAIAVTGLAGPFADENGVPYPLDPRHEPGLVFVSGATKRGAVVKRCVFTGDRASIRRQTVLEAVLLLKNMVQNRL